MRQLIPFKKDIIFKTKISDITSISLEHTLNLDDDTISGDFIVSGDYKMTEASVNKEDFYYKLPFDIALDSRYDTSNLKIEINDFYYEIINSDVLRVNIEVSLDGLEEKETYIEKTYQDVDDDVSILDINEDDTTIDLEKQIDDLQEELVRNHEHATEVKEEKIEEKRDDDMIEEIDKTILENKDETSNINTQEIKSLFTNLSEEETFSTYHVYILRSDDTIESVMTKYNVNKEILSQYNDIDNIKLGDKIIIPALTNDQ